MLKKIILLGVMAYAFNAHSQQLSTNHEIDTSWTAPAGTYTVCPSTPTANCALDYKLTITPPTGTTGTPPVITVAWGSTSNAWLPGGALYCGTWNLSLIAEYMDFSSGTGVLKQSTPVTGQATVSAGCPIIANPASGLGITVK